MGQIIAFTGVQGAGKDYQCDLLVEKGFKKLAFADALREIAFTTLGISQDYGLQHYTELKQTPVTSFGYTLRQVLEHLGTEGIRKYDNDFWCRCLVKTLQDNKYENVCISDLRFPNEFMYLYNYAKENNYEFKCVFCDYKSVRYSKDNSHESARMSNWLKEYGFVDLQEVTVDDITVYRKGELNGKNY